MKICFLAPANNYHTQKWCHYFTTHNYDVYVISLTDGQIENAKVFWLNSNATQDSSDFQKLEYLTEFRKVRKLVNEISPDIINVHYATSYGALAAMAGLHNYILSVWGADVYDFPRRSFLHRALLKYSLNSAAYIFSTSNAMAKETKKYTAKSIFVTPFGVDMDLFNPDKRTRVDDEKFVIGTVKKLAPKYGIGEFLKAVHIVRNERPDIPLYVRIAGKSGKENYGPVYKELAKHLGISDIVSWLGFIPQAEAAKEWANMDCGIIFSESESESFGVSAVEAQAAGIPVIISDIPGLMEATEPGLTSIVVPRKDIKQLAQQIIYLYDHPNLRREIGVNGRFFVSQTYEMNHCFAKVEDYYHQLLGV